MSSTTNFDDWIEENDPEGHEEIYALYQAISSREGFGNFDVTTDGEKTFIKGNVSTLVLVNENARAAFSKMVDELKGDDTMDMDSWYGFQRNMANPKA